MASLTVGAVQVGSGMAVTDFRFIVNADNVRDPNDPDPTRWPSLSPAASHSPLVATGDAAHATVDVPPGRYLVTIRAPEHKLGGEWITVSGDTAVTVALQPHPLPLCKLRVRVFHDNHPVNGEDDLPLESGLAGFRIDLHDVIGELTVDYLGNPLSVFTDSDGNALIENLPPGKYEVEAIPPDGTDWVQTSTIEGTRAIDAWIEEGSDGYTREEGYLAPLAAIGFVRPMEFPPPAPDVPVGTITGTVRGIVEARPPALPTPGEPVDRPWVALTDIGTNDTQVFLGRGGPDGRFSIPNVPPGLYQLAVWDDPLDYIISFRTVRLAAGETVAMGDIAIPRWFGQIEGTVYHDANQSGRPDPGEPGIPLVDMGTRFKDGSLQYGTVTGPSGQWSLPEVYELEAFAIAELGFVRFAPTGEVVTPGANWVPPGLTTSFPANLLLAEFTGAGSINRILWGMKEYPQAGADGQPGTTDDLDNGGITGIAYYATMRNEIDPRRAAAEDYEPGIPGVTVNLYALNPDGSLTFLQSVQTDAWQQPTDCTRIDGIPDPQCIELPRLGDQIKPAVFDGGYAFVDLAPGDYVVEVVPPPGYEILAEGTENTGDGDFFIRSLAQPPYLGDSRTRKVVTLQSGQNPAADFYLYTYVPVPGRIIGLLADDLNLETNPDSPYYLEKRPLGNTPVGIRDYTGRLLRTVLTDANGVFEILLPSTYTANAPVPSGVAPGMYRVIGNDPGDPDRPNPTYNPDYQTLPLVFDVWPGKTTYADVAVLPITARVEGGNMQFARPPAVQVPPGTPQVFLVDPVFVHRRDRRQVTIHGTDFGRRRGRVTLAGKGLPVANWTDTQITVFVPDRFTAGPGQLLVFRADGRVSPTGITMHVLGEGYDPPVVVATPATGIQAILDQARDGDLIVVRPGTYYENLLLHKCVKLQGMGWKWTQINGRFFAQGEAAWLDRLSRIDFDGPGNIPRGQAITVLGRDSRSACTDPHRPLIDGFTITGARGRAEAGGGILLNAYCRFMAISNNVIEQNGGAFGGGITIGRPYKGDTHNDHVRIHHNRILSNGGISLAGGVAVFNGADNYVIADNDIIGNYSAEYGGGISHLGLSQGGRIERNRILFNAAFDEGGGVVVGGEQPLPPAVLSVGSGDVIIAGNLIQGNLSGDDGGGIRLLRAGTWPIRIFNNMVIANVAADIGGGVALDDASDVILVNNTIAGNATTATAEDSDGLPHGAGLCSENHSAPFQDVLPHGAPKFSDPVQFNNIFWDNRAYHFDPNTGRLAPDYDVIDQEVYGTLTPARMTPHYSYLSTEYGQGEGNVVYNGCNPPAFVREYPLRLTAVAMRGQPDFRDVRLIVDAADQPANYHLTRRSPARDSGVRNLRVEDRFYPAPATDFDGDRRSLGRGCDMGADEFVCWGRRPWC